VVSVCPMTTHTYPEPLIRARDVAAILCVSIETVRRYEEEGALHGVRLSTRALRFRMEDVRALIAERSQPVA
jgi:predicted site-specific integrase-resolvase